MKYLLILLLPFFMIACEEAEDEDACGDEVAVCTCDRSLSSPSTCRETRGNEVDTAAASCAEDPASEFSTTQPCSTSGVVGTCTISLLSGSSGYTDYYYSDAGVGQVACGLVGGQWE